jgi:hypothetical protein
LESLAPGKADQTRPASIEIIREMIASSPNPRFVQNCQEFLAEFREGDLVMEYCTSKQSWNEGMGMAGFHLMRGEQKVTTIMTRMN